MQSAVCNEPGPKTGTKKFNTSASRKRKNSRNTRAKNARKQNVTKQTKTNRPKRPPVKKRGDKLKTLELSNEDGFTTDEDDETDDKQYEECKHFEIQSRHAEDRLKQPASKKKRKNKALKIKIEIRTKMKPQDIRIKLENVAEATKKKKLKKKKREAKLLAKKQNNDATCQKISNEEEILKEDASKNNAVDNHKAVIKTEAISEEEELTEAKQDKHQKPKQDKVTRKRKGPKSDQTGKKQKKSSDVPDTRKHDPNRKMFVGAHVSIAGGLYKSVLEAVNMKAHAFAIFLKSQRQWNSKPLDNGAAMKFKETYQKYGFLPEHILPHGSYLMNLGSPDPVTLQKSRDMLVDELKRCEKLGLTLFNFHPGSTCGKVSVDECLETIAESINLAHSQTTGVITVIENMSCQGNTIGGKFEEIKGIINKVNDKSRVGVCLDTCHAFAAGFDLSTKNGFNQFVADFDKKVGFQYLKALHLNDSKGKLGCHLDRHENIGKGFIGKDGFNRIMNHKHFINIPMILETPLQHDSIYAEEVDMLYSMCKL